MKSMVILAAALMVGGCATGPKTALRTDVLKAGHVVYFEQSDRVPKDVLTAGVTNRQAMVMSMAALSPEDILKFLDEVVKMVPELSKAYGEERMYNALIGRRILFIGYDTPEQLDKIRAIVEAMGGCIEPVVP